MDAAPDPGPLNPPVETPEASAPGPRWWMRIPGRTLLVACVLVLGLLQGARAALGPAPLASAPAAPDLASPPARENDWRRGHFFRPAGSTASRPRAVLRPLPWRPAPPAAAVARACASSERSC